MSASYQHLFVPGTDPEAPPLLLLHGTGGNERDLLPLARTLSPGSAVLSPRGDVSEHGQLRFFRRFAEGVFDLDDVRRRTHALADFVIDAATRYQIPRDKLLAIGFSNGANIAGTLFQLRPEVLGGAIMLRPMVVLDQSASALSLSERNIFISSGNADPIVPAEQPLQLAKLFRAGGANVTLKIQNASHGLAAGDIADAQTWLETL
jgi:predicted esterase